MDTLRQFGPMEPEVEEKWKYARQLAAKIKKALDTGTPYVSTSEPLDTPPGGSVSEGRNVSQPPAQPPQSGVAAGGDTGVAELDALLHGGLPAVPASKPYAAAPAPQVPPAQLGSMEAQMAQLQGILGNPTPPAPVQPRAYGGAPAGPPGGNDAALQAEIQRLQQDNATLRASLQQAQQQVQLLQQHIRSGAGAGAAPIASTHTPSFEKILEAQKSAKFAVSSLQFKDVSTARENLKTALDYVNGVL